MFLTVIFPNTPLVIPGVAPTRVAFPNAAKHKNKRPCFLVFKVTFLIVFSPQSVNE